VKSLPLLAFTAMMASAMPVRAQTVVQPEPPLDSTQAVIHDALYLLRDSLQYVGAASARFARDRNISSDAVLRSRAKTMAERCETVVRISGEVREVVVRSARPDPDAKGERPRYLGALDELRHQMELRDYGIGKGKRVDEAIQVYHAEIIRYFYASTGRRYQPYMRDAGATPTGH
jgi:hypothetical protein